MRSLVVGAVALGLSLAAAACGNGLQAQPRPTTALQVCAAHFNAVTVARPTTVGEIRVVGPKVTLPQPLDKYSDSTGATLCLVPKGEATYQATAVIASDGAIYVRWIQNVSDNFIFPT